MSAKSDTSPSSAQVRRELVRALSAELVGPFFPSPGPEASAEVRARGEELLGLPPSRWYLTGFLAPVSARQREDPTDDEGVEAGDLGDDPGEAQEGESAPRSRGLLPASLGLSVLLPAEASTVHVRVEFADYTLEETLHEDGSSADLEPGAGPRERWSPHLEQRWRRVPRGPYLFTVPLDADALRAGREVEGSGLWLVGELRPAVHPGFSGGEKALSLFLVNRREPGPRGQADVAYVFQVSLSLHSPSGFLSRPSVREEAEDWDASVAALQYRHTTEYAVGHGVSAEARPRGHGPVQDVTTSWIPAVEVPRVVTRDFEDVELGMDALAELSSPEAVRRAFTPLVDRYAQWILAQRALDPGPSSHDEGTQRALMDLAERARGRILEGIERLAEDPMILEAFRTANRAMATAARRRSPELYATQAPRWRLFQLAFLLLNLPSLASETHPSRETVELLFFPTGGGKTEAYLGAVAFVLLLRRLRGQARPDGGLGVAVLLRYTLRLLTLDQLGRAATLICALELHRREQPERLGKVRFAVGLWVGRSATANTLEEMRLRLAEYKQNTSPTASSPCPLASCPWCRTPFEKNAFVLEPKHGPSEVNVFCSNFACPFSQGRGLPVLFVDEQLYRELPAFVVATVDKFALLPWRAEVGKLFGNVVEGQLDEDRARFLGHGEVQASKGPGNLPEGLRPPELIIQDELHLISGPLGTMVGLYETALEVLTHRPRREGRATGPKIIASTATVRRASDQVRALFGRTDMAVFPPAGVDANESFFATVDRASPGRLYLGVAAPGKSMKAILLKVYIALLGAASRASSPRAKPGDPAEPYLTLVGYFNSLRELGGMRRLVEDEVFSRLRSIEARRPSNLTGPHPWHKNRELREPVELTSREKTENITRIKARLESPHQGSDRVDVLLASNMLSVGVDIDRLGLMVIAGQPKTTSEYIQASSRVGRAKAWPGLVVTALNVQRPRDRSHYERFIAFHETFYRFVEATSVTPFSAPALDRGLAALVVGLLRHGVPELSAPDGVMHLSERAEAIAVVLREIARRAGRTQRFHSASDQDAAQTAIAKRVRNILERLEAIVEESSKQGGGDRCYSPWDRGKLSKPILRPTEQDEETPPAEAPFVLPSSMRDVEASVHLWISRQG